MDIGAATAFEININKSKRFGIWQAFGGKSETHTTIAATRNVILPPAQGTEGWVYMGKRSGQSWQTLYMNLPSQGLPQPGTLEA